jgi:cob(I)alamin adenosyltransferase
MTKTVQFTARGDDGRSDLLGQGRYSKAGLRFEVLGSLDECSAIIGVAKSLISHQDTKNILTEVQRDLYHIMGEVSVIPGQKEIVPPITPDYVTRLEGFIFSLEKEVKSPEGFILPGDTIQQAVLDFARTVIRRAERRLIPLYEAGELENSVIRQYINRLSSLIYQLELFMNYWVGKDEHTMAKER